MISRERPRDAGLKHMRLPVGAYASILHRITGVLLIAATGLGLVLLHASLGSVAQFRGVRVLMTHPWAHIVGPLAVWAGAQHLYGGIRHLAMDADRGFGRTQGRRSAAWVMALAVITALVAALLWP
ncbi:MAG: succinate dehydrogenase, cytochrome b556 subunit [Acidiferrobacter sp.]